MAPIIVAAFWLCIIIIGAGAYVLNGGMESISSEAIPVKHDEDGD